MNSCPDELVKEATNLLNFIESVLTSIRKNSQASVLVNGFEVPVSNSFGVLDYQYPDKKVNAVRDLNRRLLELINKFDGVYYVDLDLIRSTIGQKAFFDIRHWHMSRLPYSRETLRILSMEYFKFIRALKGKNKKCLILDCDNTLWGGIVGEDGLNHITIGKTYPGSAYKEFQEAILDLYHRGVMICLCSKNDQEAVLNVLDKHPDMVLKRDHFLKMKINWNDKSQNIREIAEELNIGLDSLVFIDDSEFETNLIRQVLPMVTTITLPKDPTLYGELLRSSGLFDSLTYSAEDKARNAMYKAQEKREEEKQNFTDIGEYLKYLEMEVDIHSADDFSIPRIFQLAQKTNQFNLTTKRYSKSELKTLSEGNNSGVFSLKLADRFGDNGIVGLMVLLYETGLCRIDSFLLSCRVIGREAEKLMLHHILEECAKRNITRIIGTYIPTAKNSLVREFYSQNKFKLLTLEEKEIEFVFDTELEKLEFENVYKKIRIEGIEVEM